MTAKRYWHWFGYCTEPGCQRPASFVVTVLVDVEHDDDGVWVGGRLASRGYCTLHAAIVAEQIAHGQPPNVALVSVVARPA